MRLRHAPGALVLLGCSSSSVAPTEAPGDSPPALLREVARTVPAYAALGRAAPLRVDGAVLRGRAGDVVASIARDGGVVELAVADRPSFAIAIHDDSAAGAVAEGSAAVFAPHGGVRTIVDVGNHAVEDIHVVAPAHATVIRERITASPEVAMVRLRERRVEAVDAHGVVRLGTAPIVAWDAHGTRFEPEVRLDRDGNEWVLSIEAPAQPGPTVIDPAWTTTPALAHARFDHAMHRLPNGKVLVVGGIAASGIDAGDRTAERTAELYDPKTNTWSAAGSFRNALAEGYTVTALPGGDLLIVGGDTNGSTTAITAVRTVERFLAKEERFATATEVSDLATPRTNHGAALVGGKVLVFGGSNGSSVLASAELFDPATGTWSAAGAMSKTRTFAAYTTLIPSGDVVVAFGNSADPDNADVYDAKTGTWSASATTTSRSFATLAAVPGDRALLFGGRARTGFGNTIGNTELFDRSTKAWSAATAPPSGHGGAPSVLLTTGELLIVGGSTGAFGGTSEYADLFDVAKFDAKDPKAWTSWVLPTVRSGHTLTRLAGGNVLLAGGGSFLPMLFNVTTRSWSDLGGAPHPARRRHAAIELDDARVLFTGGTSDGYASMALSEIFGAPFGGACTAASDCTSGFCVDGVCCDTSCDTPCGACNLPGKQGTCSPVTGPPLGGRTCPGDIPADVCAVPACDGKTTATCAGFAGGPDTVCVPGRCEGSVLVGASRCNGTGQCIRTDETACAPFGCRAGACLAKCASSADCVGGATCDVASGTCIAQARCTDDRLGYLDEAGKARSCGAFRCGQTGTCLTTCATSDDCSPGSRCSEKACLEPMADGDSGGCAFGAPGGSIAASALLVALLGFVARRRRTEVG